MMVLHTVHVELSYYICGVCLREHVLLFPPDPQCSYTVTAGPLQRLNVLLEVVSGVSINTCSLLTPKMSPPDNARVRRSKDRDVLGAVRTWPGRSVTKMHPYP